MFLVVCVFVLRWFESFVFSLQVQVTLPEPSRPAYYALLLYCVFPLTFTSAIDISLRWSPKFVCAHLFVVQQQCLLCSRSHRQMRFWIGLHVWRSCWLHIWSSCCWEPTCYLRINNDVFFWVAAAKSATRHVRIQPKTFAAKQYSCKYVCSNQASSTGTPDNSIACKTCKQDAAWGRKQEQEQRYRQTATASDQTKQGSKHKIASTLERWNIAQVDFSKHRKQNTCTQTLTMSPDILYASRRFGSRLSHTSLVRSKC